MEIALINLQKLQLIADDITELLKYVYNIFMFHYNQYSAIIIIILRIFFYSRLISPLESPYKLATISIPIYDEVISDSVNKIKRHMNDTGRKSICNYFSIILA